MNARDGGLADPGRRVVLTAAVATGGGLLLGIAVPMSYSGPALAKASAPDPAAFIRIARDGQVTLVLPYVEMGQGAYTAQVQILCEELETRPDLVAVEAAPPDETRYASPLFGGQITGGSGSLRGAWRTLRTAGAACRVMLIRAAAEQWRVPVSECHAVAGEVVHAASRRRAHYGVLAERAARLSPPSDPPLKAVDAYRVVGKPIARFEGRAKVDGTARFGIDARPAGLRYATVAASPVFAGKVDRVDAAACMKVRGVSQVVVLDDVVAVVASDTWAAKKGLAALDVRWAEGAQAGLGTADLVAEADRALDRPGVRATDLGDVTASEAASAGLHEAVYRLPMLAHAAMEPLNCTVHVRDGGCEVWVGSQVLGRAQKAAADAAGVPLERVVVHNHLLGGGFGRRLEVDYVAQAVRIARQVTGPLKVTWSREEDIRHDAYRYLNHSRVTVALDPQGRPVGWRHKVVGPNIMARFLPVYQKDGVDLDVVNCASGPYDIANVRIEYSRNEAPTGLMTGNWRGVGPTRNVFIVEGVMDQLAAKAGKDPVAFRRALMTGAPRTRAVLDLAAEKAGWDKPLPAGTGRGVAVFTGFDSHVAVVAEVQVPPSGIVKVTRLVCAVDAGVVVNPDLVRAQFEGGAIFGVSAVLHGRITVADGRVVEGNFNDYPVLRMKDAPTIDVHIVASHEEPGGVGEPGTAGAIAAVANAVAAVTGRPVLSLPLHPYERSA